MWNYWNFEKKREILCHEINAHLSGFVEEKKQRKPREIKSIKLGAVKHGLYVKDRPRVSPFDKVQNKDNNLCAGLLKEDCVRANQICAWRQVGKASYPSCHRKVYLTKSPKDKLRRKMLKYITSSPLHEGIINAYLVEKLEKLEKIENQRAQQSPQFVMNDQKEKYQPEKYQRVQQQSRNLPPRFVMNDQKEKYQQQPRNLPQFVIEDDDYVNRKRVQHSSGFDFT